MTIQPSSINTTLSICVGGDDYFTDWHFVREFNRQNTTDIKIIHIEDTFDECITSRSYIKIAQFIGNLEVLEIENTHITDDDLLPILNRHGRSLKKLILKDNLNLTAAIIYGIAQNCIRLEHLDVRDEFDHSNISHLSFNEYHVLRAGRPSLVIKALSIKMSY